MPLLLAHAGHWLESVALALPPMLLICFLVGAAIYARRHEATSQSDHDQEAPE